MSSTTRRLATHAPPSAPALPSVLAEVPRLASVLERLATADQAMLAAVAELADLLATDEVERVTGVGVDHWLAAVSSQTRMDRRLLVRTCRLLGRLPTLDDAVRTGRVSFAQLRGLTLALRAAPAELDEELDRLLGALLDGLDRLERPDPDVLVRQVTDALDELRPDDLAERERAAAADRYVTLQPYLDGTGGRFQGQLDAPGLALFDASTRPPETLLDHPGGLGAARADTMLARLAGAVPTPTEGTLEEPQSADPTTDDEVALGSEVAGIEPSPWWAHLTPPKLVLRVPFGALLDDRMPADLLTGLVGGRLRLTASAARRLTDARGAQLRSVVVDEDGSVIGVGRATRRPPGWLWDAMAALHDTCTGPGCDRAARGADLDHAAPWWPARSDDPLGTTDVDNVGPLCPTTNREKEAAGWRVTQTAAGIRRWHHPRSGLTTTTVPSTWRPPDDPRRHRAPRGPGGTRRVSERPPPGAAPPGPDRPGAVPPEPDPAAPDAAAPSRRGDGPPALPF
jgi:hypothetical protein